MDEPIAFLIAGMASIFGSLFGAWQIVLRSHIADKAWANIVGMGVVPTAFTAAGYYACSLAHPPDPGMPMGIATFTLSGGMIGGWIGAWLGYMTNQKNSADPELRRQFHETMAQAERQGKRRSVGSWLRASGLPETRSNVWQWQIGSIVVAVSFVATIYQMIALDFMSYHILSYMPWGLRLLGAVAPCAIPGLLWALTRRLLPSLAASLGSGTLSMMICYVPVYLIINIVAHIQTR